MIVYIFVSNYSAVARINILIELHVHFEPTLFFGYSLSGGSHFNN